MDDILKTLRDAGFKPKANEDVDFPPVKGEYRVDVKSLKPWVSKDSGEMEAYMLELRVTETLSGDKADGRTFTRFYRMGGLMFKDGVKVPVQATDKAEAFKNLCNDLYTLDGGPTLDTSSTEAFEVGFSGLIGAIGYVRSWHFASKEDPDRKIQQWIIKAHKDLRKDSKGEAEKSSIPF